MTASEETSAQHEPTGVPDPPLRGGRILTPEQSEALVRAAEDYREKQAGLMEAVGVLWNAQVDMAMAADDADLLARTLGRPLGLFDDCSCGCGPAPTPTH